MNRMTSSSPFVDPSYITDVKVKILERKIEWQPLIQTGISEAGERLRARGGWTCTTHRLFFPRILVSPNEFFDTGLHFVKRLLEDNPELRMTLTDALSHPWLAPCRPADAPRLRVSADDIASAAQAIIRDVSMRDPLTDCMSMNLDPPAVPAARSEEHTSNSSHSGESRMPSSA